MSLTFLLRNLLMTISGQVVERAAVSPCLEDRIASASQSLDIPKNVGTASMRPAVSYRDQGALPHVEILGLSEVESDALLTAARAHGTTIQTALSAAVAKVLSADFRSADGGPLRILTPLDTRKRLLDGADDLGVFVAGSVVSDPGETADPWDRALGFDTALRPLKSPAGTTMAICALSGAMAGIKTPDEASDFFARALGAEAMITNLGALSIPVRYGPLELDQVWGPAVSLGFADEQSIGVNSLNGRIGLVYTSYSPIEGLLTGVWNELTVMSSVNQDAGERIVPLVGAQAYKL